MKWFCRVVFAFLGLVSGWVADTTGASTTDPLLLTQPNSTRAIALDSTTGCREPFVPIRRTPPSYGLDQQTRISLFAMNIGPPFGDQVGSLIKADAEDFAHNRHSLPVEYVGNVPGHPWLQMVMVKLNENIGPVGDVLVSILARGKTSNRVRVGIGFIGGGLPDDSTPSPTPTPTPTPAPTPTTPQNPPGCDYYVSTSGSSGNPGTIGSPWSLAYAFTGAGGKITAGKTVCLRAGAYLNTSGWSIDPSLDGTSSSPIIFRNYPGERATLDTGSGSTNPVLVLNGDYNWIIGLEIMNSSTSPGELDSGDGISHGTATGDKVIDCIIHDNTGNGIGAFSSLTDFEAFGNVLYYNGKTPNNGNNNAYNIYVQNTGPLGKTFRSNALFHCFGNYPAHMYGSRNMDNLHWSNNAGTNYHNGKWWLVDSGIKAQNFVFQNNYLYSEDKLPGIFDLGAHGFGAGTNGARVTGNYFGWGTISMNVLNSGTVFTNNTVYFGDLLQFAAGSCANCASFTGNTFTTSRPETNWGPFVTPDRYEPGRAMVVLYNWQNLDRVAVDFSSFLNVGNSYEIRDAQNYYGPLIGSGTYSGGMVTISTTSTELARPTAVPPNRSAPTHTPKEYQVWIVIRTLP